MKGDTISRSALLNEFDPDEFPSSIRVRSRILQAPTVDAAPVVHGQWETIEVYGKTTLYRCTACKTEMVDYTGREGYHRYCHICGARMDGGEGE